MAILSSQGTLTVANAAPLRLSTVSQSGPFFDGYRRTYGQIYRTQPAVRTVIDFFARNIAQLGLHAFRRLNDTDRERITNHGLPRLIKRPNYSTTRYRFIESTVQDIAIYANGYWWKVRGKGALSLVRLPAAEVSVKGTLLPTGYVWTPCNGTDPKDIDPADIVHFRLYDPANPVIGFPPLETLRTILSEEAAASAYRRAFWQNGAKFETVISRPAAAPKWDPNDRQDFRKSWHEFAGKRAGMTPILEDGMTVQNVSQNFRDAEASQFRKLMREEVAAEYHVPLPMVGILEHATFSNIKEQHKQLYQDTLGPWLTMMEEEIELTVVPEFEDLDPETTYLEFNIAEKMKGSFEEQAQSLSLATGRPIMTGNEARARINLPRHTNPTMDDVADTSPGQGQAFGGSNRGANDTAALATVLRSHASRQSTRIEKDAPDVRAATFAKTAQRWAGELAADLLPVFGDEERARVVAGSITQETHARLARGLAAWSPGRIVILLEELARG